MLVTTGQHDGPSPARGFEAWARPRSRAEGAPTAAPRGRVIDIAPAPARHPRPPVEVEAPRDDRPWPALLADVDDGPDPWLAIERQRERAERLAREQRGR